MFKNQYTYYINNLNKILPKINNLPLNEKEIIKKINFFKELEVRFIIKSEIKQKKIFITIIILLEKSFNNLSIFLLNTFLKKKIIKIGCIFHLKNELLNNYLFFCFQHSLFRLHNQDKIYFYIKKSKEICYKLNKILFHSPFYYNQEIDNYYNLLDIGNYKIYFVFRSIFFNKKINQLLLNLYGFQNFFIIESINNIIIQEIFQLLINEKQKKILEGFEENFFLQNNKDEEILINFEWDNLFYYKKIVFLNDLSNYKIITKKLKNYIFKKVRLFEYKNLFQFFYGR